MVKNKKKFPLSNKARRLKKLAGKTWKNFKISFPNTKKWFRRKKRKK